jgi:hypothetical protein
MYVPVSDIQNAHKDNKNRGLNAGGADERELEEALQRSLADAKEQSKKNMDDDEEDGKMVGTVLNRKNNKQEDEKNKFQAFSGKGVSFASPEQD